MRAGRWLLLVVVGAIAFTLLGSVMAVAQAAFRGPSLHVAPDETAVALIALLSVQLMHGRFRRSLDRGGPLLTAPLVLFAGGSLEVVSYSDGS
jgi:hypothetical protein